MSQLIDTLHKAVSGAKGQAGDAKAAVTAAVGHAQNENDHHFIDVTFKFIGASGLPKMDVVGSADPYFVAKLDKLSFVSTVKPNTLTPVWNEFWKIRNVPKAAILQVDVLDKDDGTITDDRIGSFSTSLTPGAQEFTIASSSLHKNRGTFWLHIDTTPSTDDKAERRQFIFDGPIRFSRHFSPTVGRLTNLNDARLYSTWKIYIKGVRMFFGDTVQHWNRDYKAAQSIFQGPTSIALRSAIQAGHAMLYARSTTNAFGVIDGPQDVFRLLLHGSVAAPDGTTSGAGPTPSRLDHLGQRRNRADAAGVAPPFSRRVKPAVYTYVISVDDDSFRFSETGAAFFVDFASKHALHSNCAQAVRYSGEFHPRPVGGWENFSDDTPDEAVTWELVIDNNSGTYSPDKAMLPDLRELLAYNFPGFTIHAWDREDPRLVQSREACRAYALENRGVRQEELQPHVAEGDQTLAQQAQSGNAPNESGPHGVEGTTAVGEDVVN